MMYASQYNADELHEMFANEVDNETLASWDTKAMAAQLAELAPGMEDATEVAEAIKANAQRNLKAA